MSAASATGSCERASRPVRSSQEMSPSSLFQEGEAGPATPVEQLAGGLAQGGLQCVIGLALGVLAAPLLRRARVRGRWAAATVGLALLLRSSLTVPSTTLVFAAACAAILARRGQRREMEAGRSEERRVGKEGRSR